MKYLRRNKICFPPQAQFSRYLESVFVFVCVVCYFILYLYFIYPPHIYRHIVVAHISLPIVNSSPPSPFVYFVAILSLPLLCLSSLLQNNKEIVIFQSEKLCCKKVCCLRLRLFCVLLLLEVSFFFFF